MTNLTVINGGGGAASGGNTGGTKFKQHPLADALWRAISPNAASSANQICSRMSKTTRQRIALSDVAGVLYHVRDNADAYGWTVAHVQRGSGKWRKYFPILVDANDPDFQVCDPQFLPYVKAGALSTARTLMTMAEHEAIAMDTLASASHALPSKDRRQIRACASMFTAASEMAKQIVAKIA